MNREQTSDWKSAARDRNLNAAVSKLMSGTGGILADARERAGAGYHIFICQQFIWPPAGSNGVHILRERIYSQKEFIKEYGRQDKKDGTAEGGPAPGARGFLRRKSHNIDTAKFCA